MTKLGRLVTFREKGNFDEWYLDLHALCSEGSFLVLATEKAQIINRADREERLQKSFWNNRRESEVALEVCMSMYKSNLSSRSSTCRRSGGRSLNAQGVVFTSALHLSFLRGTTELKELEGGLEHAKAALKDAKAAKKVRPKFVALSHTT
eukprot:jgi/Tetstr1/466044/TSEL_010631.t1